MESGGKKRNDILQMAVLEPELCILDESDSGLDIDALKIVAEGVNALRDDKRAFIIVTHYQRILDYIKPDYVHVLYQGRIVRSGDFTLVKQLEEQVSQRQAVNFTLQYGKIRPYFFYRKCHTRPPGSRWPIRAGTCCLRALSWIASVNSAANA